MAANLLTLEQWTKANFTPLIESPANATEAYRHFFPMHPKITINGTGVTPGGYMSILGLEFGQEAGASVKFENVVVVPTTTGSEEAGSVGFFFTATIAQGTSSRSLSSSVNLVIEPDNSVQDSDKRRVTSMTQVILDNGTNPVKLLVKG
ncbi:hypothetical protein OE88DRAFT_1809161 [Heliocybe sulcata]|uniref:Uncharacterized protein n=1 Tax=Heliocybe sulcata TaxID=5364 RepID=A0A5C3N253_9AGAM|nr:hypothetical protein OE88DRAFT_1809161 [Heliocybe sulcata]